MAFGLIHELCKKYTILLALDIMKAPNSHRRDSHNERLRQVDHIFKSQGNGTQMMETHWKNLWYYSKSPAGLILATVLWYQSIRRLPPVFLNTIQCKRVKSRRLSTVRLYYITATFLPLEMLRPALLQPGPGAREQKLLQYYIT